MVPTEFVTVTLTELGEVAGGLVTTSEVELSTWRLLPATPPKLTIELVLKFVPVIVTLVPPVVGPEVVPKLVIVGAAAL